MGPNGLRRVIARSARATSARSRTPGSGDNLAQLVRSRNCSRPREQGCRAGPGWQRHSQVPARCGRLSLDGPIPRRSRSGRAITGRLHRRPVMAHAGHTGEAQVTVPPAQHPVPGAPGVAEPGRPGTASTRCQRPSARGGRHSTAASCRGQTSHSTPTRPRACPGNALQAPAADADDAGFAQL